MMGMRKKVANYLFISQKSYNFAAENEKIREMIMKNDYFYGFYFYFAGSCEAERRKEFEN